MLDALLATRSGKPSVWWLASVGHLAVDHIHVGQDDLGSMIWWWRP